MCPRPTGADGASFDPTVLYWIFGCCAGAFTTFIGITLMVALFASRARAVRAEHILTGLLDFLDKLLGRFTPPFARTKSEPGDNT